MYEQSRHRVTHFSYTCLFVLIYVEIKKVLFHYLFLLASYFLTSSNTYLHAVKHITKAPNTFIFVHKITKSMYCIYKCNVLGRN